ncbi:MAG: zinc ribbon domain-containing protein [Candidatus Methanomethylophilaceae archaeon]|nr:zinc ribbon domain-containing protein [Candidatus Methanomethylophilaceae archaeon]
MDDTSSVYCPNCGKEVGSEDVYCSNCFAALSSYTREGSTYKAEGSPSSSSGPGWAVMLSVLVPGLGGLVTGHPIAAVAIFASSVVALYVALSSAVMVPLCLSVMIVLWLVGIRIVTNPGESYRRPQSS